jgi:hypothetical protein
MAGVEGLEKRSVSMSESSLDKGGFEESHCENNIKILTKGICTSSGVRTSSSIVRCEPGDYIWSQESKGFVSPPVYIWQAKESKVGRKEETSKVHRPDLDSRRGSHPQVRRRDVILGRPRSQETLKIVSESSGKRPEREAPKIVQEKQQETSLGMGRPKLQRRVPARRKLKLSITAENRESQATDPLLNRNTALDPCSKVISLVGMNQGDEAEVFRKKHRQGVSSEAKISGQMLEKRLDSANCKSFEQKSFESAKNLSQSAECLLMDERPLAVHRKRNLSAGCTGPDIRFVDEMNRKRTEDKRCYYHRTILETSTEASLEPRPATMIRCPPWLCELGRDRVRLLIGLNTFVDTYFAAITYER